MNRKFQSEFVDGGDEAYDEDVEVEVEVLEEVEEQEVPLLEREEDEMGEDEEYVNITDWDEYGHYERTDRGRRS